MNQFFQKTDENYEMTSVRNKVLTQTVSLHCAMMNEKPEIFG